MTALVTAGLLAGTATAATPTKVSATGKIIALSPVSITIDSQYDLRCRVVTVTPRALGFRIGSRATVTCVKGVLKAIAPVLRSPTPTPQPSPTPATETPPEPAPTILLPPPRLQ
jgi:hypothetical protein